MDVNTKSKFRRGQAALSENEINDLINVVKESAEAVAEATKDNKPTTPLDKPASTIQPTKTTTSRKFYAIEKNRTTGKYDVVEAVEQDGVIKRTGVVGSHDNVAVSIARLNEAVSRLCLIKKDF